MNISTIDTRVLINVINKELEITRLRNKFENHFFDEVIEREEEEK
jgi:hypothetical protein